jgi:hypothetical protein
MEFIEEIGELLRNSGIDFSMEIRGDVGVFTCKGIHIIAEPIKEATIEEARDKQAQVKSIVDGMEKYPIILPEDRWECNRKLAAERLLAHLGEFDHIFARNCEVRRIEKAIGGDFLDRFHSYGDASGKYRYGVFVAKYSGKATFDYPIGTLVAVAEFSNARKWAKGEKTIKSYEWVKYASIPSVRVVGGMGKVLQKFIADVNPDDIMSYADLEWSDGDSYSKLGFSQESFRPEVEFIIEPHSWKRMPIDKLEERSIENYLYYKNFGSMKYRLSRTEY